MARTTLDIDTPILDELKAIQRETGKTLGRLVSDLLARALADRSSRTGECEGVKWVSRPMRARVPLEDKEEIQRILDDDESASELARAPRRGERSSSGRRSS